MFIKSAIYRPRMAADEEEWRLRRLWLDLATEIPRFADVMKVCR